MTAMRGLLWALAVVGALGCSGDKDATDTGAADADADADSDADADADADSDSDSDADSDADTDTGPAEPIVGHWSDDDCLLSASTTDTGVPTDGLGLVLDLAEAGGVVEGTGALVITWTSTSGYSSDTGFVTTDTSSGTIQSPLVTNGTWESTTLTVNLLFATGEGTHTYPASLEFTGVLDPVADQLVGQLILYPGGVSGYQETRFDCALDRI